MGRGTRVVVTIIAAAVLLLGPTGSRAATIVAGAGAWAALGNDGMHTVAAEITAIAVPSGLGTYMVGFVCVAAAAVDPASVTIDRCSAGGQSPPTLLFPISCPGAVCTTGFVYLALPAQEDVELCVHATAIFIEGALGPMVVGTDDTDPCQFMPTVGA